MAGTSSMLYKALFLSETCVILTPKSQTEKEGYHGSDIQKSRDNKVAVTASQAILKGLSEDGGLFMPAQILNWICP